MVAVTQLILGLEEIQEAVQQMSHAPLSQIFNEREAFAVVRRLGETARKRLLHQDAAIDQITAVLKQRFNVQRQFLTEVMTGVPKLEPLARLLLAGPTGTGKTELGRIITEVMFANPERLIMINCSTIGEESPHAISSLVGAPPGYVGYGTGGTLTRPLAKGGNWIILLDEVEKMAKTVARDILVPALDEGLITDQETGTNLSIADSVVICTCNLLPKAEGTVGFRTIDDTGTAYRKGVLSTIEAFFPPELLTRFDAVVVFDPWTSETIRQLGVDRLTQWVRHKNQLSHLDLELSDEAGADFTASLVSIKNLGAREAQRVVQKLVEPVEQYLLDHPGDYRVVIQRSPSGGLDYSFEHLST